MEWRCEYIVLGEGETDKITCSSLCREKREEKKKKQEMYDWSVP